MSRNITTAVLLTDLFGSYLKSFFIYMGRFYCFTDLCFINIKNLEISKSVIIICH